MAINAGPRVLDVVNTSLLTSLKGTRLPVQDTFVWTVIRALKVTPSGMGTVNRKQRVRTHTFLKRKIQTQMNLVPMVMFQTHQVGFEGRLKIFRQHSLVCCNFENASKTMAKMSYLSNLKSVKRDHDENRIEHQTGTSIDVFASPHAALLKDVNLKNEDTVLVGNCGTVREVYRPGLFVCLLNSTPILPLFGMIQQVLVTTRRSVVFIVTPWKNLRLSLTQHI
ncbi:hypothetical protein ONE63_001019 [Megalurothrips usitatus]|uniref:Uncharacterized protein n=1 Tax=Megalurothrips usitatus TaxID=439358 RepID=A0AAV7XAT6_9NEOP|nr:hypothetical protein ONE63_001019 [Megalurothrips usitatus]